MRRHHILVAIRGGVLFLVAAHAWSGVLVAQQGDARHIRGIVTDSLGRPIVYANVQTTGQSRTVTDDSGHFSFSAPPNGEIALRIYRLGYTQSNVRLAPAGDTLLRITLKAIPRLLEATQVTAERMSRRLDVNGFYSRLINRHKGIGSGTFFTHEDIVQRNPQRITAILDNVPGVRVKRRSNSVIEWDILGPNGCEYTVYLDGNRIHPALTDSRRYNNRVYIDELLSANGTAAIEVYPRASGAPERFQMLSGTCGVVMFWSR